MSGLWQLVGGGGALVISMCYTLIGDVCSPEKRYVPWALPFLFQID